MRHDPHARLPIHSERKTAEPARDSDWRVRGSSEPLDASPWFDVSEASSSPWETDLRATDF